MRKAFLFGLALLLALGAESLLAQSDEPTLRIRFGIDVNYPIVQSSRLDLPIIYEGSAISVNQITLAFGCNGYLFQCLDSLSSSLSGARVITETTTDTLSSDYNRLDDINALTRLRFSANTDSSRTAVITLKDGDTLVVLHYTVLSDRSLSWRFWPLRWLWLACGDNTIVSGNMMYTVLSVDDVINSAKCGFEGRYSIQDISPNTSPYDTNQMICDRHKGSADSIYQRIEFVNSGVPFDWDRGMQCGGDVNLNGLSNEFADLMVFRDYFVGGLTVFHTNIDGQTAATEMNENGIPLEVSDFALMSMKNTRTTRPRQQEPSRTPLNVSCTADTVFLNQPVMAALFVFQDSVAVESLAPNMTLSVGIRDGNTYAFLHHIPTVDIPISRTNPGPVIRSNGKLLSVEAADTLAQSFHPLSIE